MKKIILTLAGLALMATNAMAFSLGGYEGPITFKYRNWEYASTDFNQNGIIDQQGEVLSGIGVVTEIYGTNLIDPLWARTTANEELTIEFGGYQATTISGSDILFSGGWVNIYLDSQKDFNPMGGPAGASGYNDGSLFLQTLGAVNPANGATLMSNLSNLTTSFSGHGTGYLDIIGGSHANIFAENVYGAGLDLLLYSTLAAPADDGSDWPIRSDDPVTGQAVPEPGTIALVGAGLVGLAFLRRKRS